MYKGIIRPYTNSFAIIYRCIDSGIIFLSLWLCIVYYEQAMTQNYLIAAFIAVCIFWLTAESQDLYRSRRTISTKEMIFIVCNCWVSCVIILFAVEYIFNGNSNEPVSRPIITSWLLLVLMILIGWRLFFRQLLFFIRRKHFNTRSVIILCYNEAGKILIEKIKRNPQLGLDLVGVYDDRSKIRNDTNQLYLSGTVDDAIEYDKKYGVDRIYIALPLRAEKRIKELLKKLTDSSATVYLLPDFFIYNLLHSRFEVVGDLLTLSVYDTPNAGLGGIVKRLMDIFLSIILILILIMPMAFIALVVVLTSKGPFFFIQNRYGLNGQLIRVFKFRTMTTMDNGSEIKQVTRNDKRVTSFGHFLRRTSLDELPQLFNVLGGSMSLVGPRPHAFAHNEEFRKIVDGYMLRHKVKPGITGWAQVNGWRGETDTKEKIENRLHYDIDYINKWSIWMDVKILMLTVIKGMFNYNAY